MAKRGNPNWGKGISGNPNGRPVVPEIQLFRDAIAEVEKKKGKSLLVHAVEQAYSDGPVLVALLKKILPDKIESDIVGNQVIVTFTERKADDKKV